jgi:5-carboxymethyl-2-hydroxymuconate isomerase
MTREVLLREQKAMKARWKRKKYRSQVELLFKSIFGLSYRQMIDRRTKHIRRQDLKIDKKFVNFNLNIGITRDDAWKRRVS